jgi:cell division protein ZapA (FtsZ GTPase activity inhibitor)
MAHERLSPRQKMIGMMYLVLTAMLALNVSKEAVEAFKKVDKGLTQTIAELPQKILQKQENSRQQLTRLKSGLMRLIILYKDSRLK